MAEPYSQTRSKKYSIWLVPEAGTFKLYRNLIFDIAKKSNCPYYDPHITIGSPILNLGSNYEDKIIDFGSSFLPLDLELMTIDYENNYFRSLYIKIAPNKALSDLNEMVQTKLKLETTEPFMPHMSIGYGIKNQRVLINKLNDKISLPHKFKADKIRVTETSGKVPFWKTMYELQVRQS